MAVEGMELERLPMKDLEGGLVGYWPFDSNREELGTDGSGNGATLEMSGGKHASGAKGGALAFQGNGFARAEHNPGLAVESDLSISLWVKPAAYGKRAGLVGKYFGEPVVIGGKPLGRSYSLKIVGGYPEVYVSAAGDLETTVTLRGSRPLPLDKWTHVAAVFEPSRSMRLYVNGQIDTARFNGVPDRIMKNESPILIGATYSVEDPEDFFTGSLDEVRIYAKPLTPREVTSLSRIR